MKAAYAIIALLLVFIMVRECTRKEPLPPSIQAHTDSISIDKARVADLEAQGSTISRKMVNDSIRHAEALQVSESRILGLTKSLAAAVTRRPEVRIDTVFILMDSVIQAQASEITILKVNTDSLRINYAALLRIKDQELKVKDEIADHMTAINQSLFKTLNKEKRKGKMAKVLIPVALVVGFILGEEL